MCKYLQLGTTNLEKPSIYFLNCCKSKSYEKKFTEFQELNEEVRRKLNFYIIITENYTNFYITF